MRNLRIWAILCLCVCAAVMFCGCTGTSTGETPEQGATTATPTPAEKIQVKVFHAGSLTGPFEKLKAAYEEEFPNTEVLLEPAGSVDTIKKVTENGKPADAVASADYALIPKMMVPDHADWYLTFAKNTMVLTYTSDSKYADEITAENWYEVLGRDGVRWAFSDPNSDPCGYRTPMVIQLAEAYYEDDQIFENLIEAHSDITVTEENGTYTIHATEPNPDSTTLTIRPKSVELVQMVQSGGLDYAWEYRSVAVQNDLEFIELPAAIDLSDIEHADTYATVQIECKKGDGTTIYTGAPIVYGVTVPAIAEHPEMGIEFVKMLIGPTGQEILTGDGQPPIVPAGGYGEVPAALNSLVAMKV
ncbi:tungstate ABC transporter substrate-binding protein WtpA [Methanoculleus sp. FWC-SCC1]|uniref:Tungstate ABC transporter substrate-binding protein WtpA n=1 Tax=Methanoculleus frigidifontis TaxID=2584085 RepID=A0ABT8MCC4_9EURY|nr:tungstate ABC transporter substrate-binding protein WtpA [Methanoculleus sp. FWC-SCC1]MDN7025594.1 tungstate ABC transporter substrate-binding protein WtpA [Methanoculleus sp. FWC-SCC1]